VDLLGDTGEGKSLGQRRRGSDDEQNHARRRRCFPQRVAQQPLAAAPVGGGKDEGIGDGDRGHLGGGGEATQDAHHHAYRKQQRRDGEERGGTARTPGGLGAGDSALLLGAEEDERHDDQGQEGGRNEAGEEQCGGGDRGDGAHDEQDDARRDGLTHDGRGGQHRHHLAARVLSFLEHAAHGGAYGRDVRDLGPGDAGEDVHGHDDHLEQTAPKVADERVHQLGEWQGQAGGVHDGSGEDEERDGQQHEALGP
jgi:hypothetical protein